MFLSWILPSSSVGGDCSGTDEVCKGNRVDRVVIGSREREWVECGWQKGERLEVEVKVLDN